ncbi:hypothetical protein Pan189_03530 [Stratiformator vulcanicus]|uniref:Uncharacterized protein n=1 Tax=Stratiformator vulcanicus TaxID=2527980 RepID=A0A517QWQ5_9PLAN|nr:hypothetical protein Pan189_03530 [Stratiformator vulcanicus]
MSTTEAAVASQAVRRSLPPKFEPVGRHTSEYAAERFSRHDRYGSTVGAVDPARRPAVFVSIISQRFGWGRSKMARKNGM